MSDLYVFRKDSAKPRIAIPDAEDRHVAMMQAIAPFAKNKVQSNVTNVEIVPSTKNTRLMLMLLPEWAANFPPFNVARLAAVAKAAGYPTKSIDLNIILHNKLEQLYKDGVIDFYPWDGAKEWKWLEQSYYKELHPYIEPTLREYAQIVVDWNPDIVGFTMYYCNEEPIKWIAQEIKRLKPSIKIAVGGPNIALRTWQLEHQYPPGLINYAINGEGEMILLEILDEVERGVSFDTLQLRYQPENQRLNLNNLPLPDYTDFDFNLYRYPNGINTEFSRGCVAKCTFCEETHFWKYRQRMATDAISEIEHLYYSKGTDVVWFIDSLVNGNLNELRAFCKAVVAKGLEIHWTGYCRCDGRMDLEFYKDLRASGCEMLNYGIESGSQKVLNDMAKGVTIAEMEQNFRDGKEVGVSAFTNWIVGFPTEEYQDFADSLSFIWRNRNMNILVIAAGFGFGLGMNTVAGQNPEKFNLAPYEYIGGWITKDFGMSKVHVLHRIKSFSIFLQNLITEQQIHIPHRPNLPKDHYKLTFNNPDLQKEITYERFDYKIIKPGISTFADNLVNEMFPLFRMLWKTRGAFKIEVKFDKDLDVIEFGDRNACPYWANHKFMIDDEGHWWYDCDFKYVQPKSMNVEEDHTPFKVLDFSHIQLNAAKRARKIAQPRWGENGRDGHEFQFLQAEEKRMNLELDLSFEYKWSGGGYWGNIDQYKIDVPNEAVEDPSMCGPVNTLKALAAIEANEDLTDIKFDTKTTTTKKSLI